MPHLNGSGPENEGSKTGRKLGKCHKTEKEQSEIGVLGKGMGKHRHSEDKEGKGKRLKYNK